MPRNKISSFTLVELLIVIAILAVLAAAVVIVLNPAELLAQARDSQRVSDLKNIKKSIDLFVVDNPTVSLGTAQRVYISLPDTASNCPNLTATLPSLPSGWQYVCVTTANLRNTNGTGWIPVNFGNVFGGSPIPYLPIDPSNDLSSGRYYTYVMGGSYELTALMEAVKENVSVSDGGSLPGVFQVGTHIDLTPPTRDRGLVGYWTFDEGSGTVAYDSSGKGNDGALTNNPLWQNESNCIDGSCLLFDGVSNYIHIPDDSSLNVEKLTLTAWVSLTAYTCPGSHGIIVNKENIYETGTLCSEGSLFQAAISPNWSWQGASTGVSPVGWHMLAVNWNGDRERFFIDGAFVYEANMTNGNAVPNTSCLRIAARGGCGGASSYFNGYLDDIRIYGRSLSDAEIKSIYEATK